MEARTRAASIPNSSPAAEPIASNFNDRPRAACSTSLRRAPRAIRIPNSLSRLLTEYAAIPKMPVIESIAPINPSTPNATVATREGNRAISSPWVQVWMYMGRLASSPRNLFRMAAASWSGSRSERTTRVVIPVGDCRNGRNIAGFGSSVS